MGHCAGVICRAMPGACKQKPKCTKVAHAAGSSQGKAETEDDWLQASVTGELPGTFQLQEGLDFSLRIGRLQEHSALSVSGGICTM